MLEPVLEAIVGTSRWTQAVRKTIVAIAPYPSSVLIVGPTGTGKELIARAIHKLSPRAAAPFVPVDCDSITGTLFASHMFGHLKGAYTGASHAALGCFRAAEGGTIFLDEVGELALEHQAKLLRVLQERCVVPIGGYREVPVNVRVIAATNRNLEHEVAAGSFRQDLYYRLNVVTVDTLPLRDRPDDIEPLARHFLAKLAIEAGIPLKRLAPESLDRCQDYDWPGNVRQLANTLERAILFTPGEVIGTEFLPDRSPADIPATIPLTASAHKDVGDPLSRNDRWPTMSELEREHIRRTLERTGYNQSLTAHCSASIVTSCGDGSSSII